MSKPNGTGRQGTRSLLESLASRVTSRDLEILAGVYDHNVMTTLHLHRLYFAQAQDRRARRRLLALLRYGLLHRFRPFSGAYVPDHWVLSRAGAEVLAAHRDIGVAELGFRQEQVYRWAFSGRLGHMLGLTECFTLTTEAARTVADAELERWDSERECARQWGQFVRPDAFMRWVQGSSALEAFWEYDTGTEPVTRVVGKMSSYKRLAVASGLPSVVLVAVHSERRQASITTRMARSVSGQVGAYVATHGALAASGPAARIWRTPQGSDPLDLVDIARRHLNPG
ncbi:hypothetical protein GCM10007079_04290 [Nocardiopsis terrae]|uniref:Replication-relaxation n=1 Tax=Nocardiopsis terrae TaxID=372655 RepID=A0ABR9HN70_9ACTN|nr:replication-relaxation family protein [Nocardiopsis terrae]MBE1460480.1 hypothetical protein [Nocardiopsis terrae]GHC71686.1 hypothetical protein GCM10007079_04290 [Nocardiopsis terrae]